MFPNIAKKWVAALRSGLYKGTKGTLKTTDINGENPRYCCLGVLCEVYNQEHKIPCDMDNDVLPLNVQKWASMQSSEGTYKWDKYGDAIEAAQLTYQNDKAKRGFKGIANIIERHVENL